MQYIKPAAAFSALLALCILIGGWGDMPPDRPVYVQPVKAVLADKPIPPIPATEDPNEDARITLALEAQGYFNPDVPLDYVLQDVLQGACQRNGVPYHVALGLIETESGFQPEAVSAAGCYGLSQLNPRYFPSGLTPAENIEAGMAYLGGLIARYGDLGAALTAYNAGHDTGDRTYASAVLAAGEKWR